MSRYKKNQENKAGRRSPSFCEVCGEREIICFDHDHSTGKFRGWICKRCNFILGLSKDSPSLLRQLAGYLERGIGAL